MLFSYVNMILVFDLNTEVNIMQNIPEIMKTISGERVTDIDTWEKYRRGELFDLFAEHIYGVRDIERPEGLYFNVNSICTTNCR